MGFPEVPQMSLNQHMERSRRNARVACRLIATMICIAGAALIMALAWFVIKSDFDNGYRYMPGTGGLFSLLAIGCLCGIPSLAQSLEEAWDWLRGH
jgi:hypothetical protein